MKRFPRKIKLNTIKNLLARSGNQCAFPECDHPLFNDSNLFVAQLCHIEALSPNAPRYNPDANDEEVNSFENLLFMCYRHHKETDDVEKYTVSKLKQIKEDHENRFKEHEFSINGEAIQVIIQDMNEFWANVEHINNYEHVAKDFKIDISSSKDETMLIKEIRQQLSNFYDIVGLLSKDLKHDNFELLCLAIPNTMTRLSVLIDQIEIKILELKLINEPGREDIKTDLSKLREELKHTAKHVGLAD
ncbi:hypothetical protein [Marinoscillum sp. MHG1-6]|uniref:hypothetical protein n=1 Tax=Marinoscillum sp. MHG1-6 TaxID=2959627 RepID=UPI0021572655|nr:hypothetical protein [Marinoscillum sp. MHG1-6]